MKCGRITIGAMQVGQVQGFAKGVGEYLCHLVVPCILVLTKVFLYPQCENFLRDLQQQ